MSSPSKAQSSKQTASTSAKESSRDASSPDKRGQLKKAQSLKGFDNGKKPMVGRAGRSSKSPDSRPSSKQQAGNANGEMTAEQQKAAIEAERQRQHDLWVLSNCTKLRFTWVDKTEKEYVVDHKMPSYAELQRYIARFTPKSNSIFAIYDIQGNIIQQTEPFRPVNVYLVREVYNRTMIPPVAPMVDIKWDFYSYHARPARWVDKAEIKRKAALAKKEEEARMLGLAEIAQGGVTVAGVANSAANRNDDAWEAAVEAAESTHVRFEK